MKQIKHWKRLQQLVAANDQAWTTAVDWVRQNCGDRFGHVFRIVNADTAEEFRRLLAGADEEICETVQALASLAFLEAIVRDAARSDVTEE